jgi:hypothetical protein
LRATGFPAPFTDLGDVCACSPFNFCSLLRFSEVFSCAACLAWSDAAGADGFSLACKLFQLLDRLPRSIAAISALPTRHAAFAPVLSKERATGQVCSARKARRQKVRGSSGPSAIGRARHRRRRTGGNIAARRSPSPSSSRHQPPQPALIPFKAKGRQAHHHGASGQFSRACRDAGTRGNRICDPGTAEVCATLCPNFGDAY